MILVLIIFAVTLFFAMPIVFVLGITGFAHLAIMDPAYLSIIPQRLFAGLNIGSLTCIAFFIVAGELMNGGGVTQKLLAFVREAIGFVNGGLAYATVIVSMILSAILGSANAVASILCSVMIPDMKEEGYDEAFSGALIAASGVLGPIIPPSVTFVFYSVLSNCSVKALFMAGVIPGILIGLSYFFVIFKYVKKKQLKSQVTSFDLKRFINSFLYALPALIVPVIILGGVIGGVFTPTESGAVACVAAVAAGVFYKSLNFRKIPAMLLRAGSATASIMIIISFGNIMGWSMAIGNVPEIIGGAILALTANKYIIIFLMLLILVVVGCLMEATAAILIFTPVMLPLALKIGMDPIHFGLVFCVMMTIALITPPVGMTLFVTSNVSKIELSKISKAVVPFAAASLIVTAVMAYVPKIVLFLPRYLFGNW